MFSLRPAKDWPPLIYLYEKIYAQLGHFKIYFSE